jgi:hypothetical protein
MNPLELSGVNINLRVNEDLSLTVRRRDGRVLWETSKTHTPILVIRSGDAKPREMPLANVTTKISPFDDGKYRGHTVLLSGFAGVDILLELIFAIDTTVDELLVQAAQVGGAHTAVSLEHFYRFEKPVSDGGYMVLPHGSGYLIPAECPDELPGEGHKGGLIGGRWTLPMFGIVRGNDAICAIVETWWDCDVSVEHTPGDQSTLDFRWLGSLGALAYPRRFFLRFAQGIDYVEMAKSYRNYARQHGLLRTLEEKAALTPTIRHDIEAILFRWPAWNPDEGPTVLAEIRALREMGFGVKFFFPKWSSAGYSPEHGTATRADANWQAYLLENPVPGGWAPLVEFANAVRQLGCTVQGFTSPRTQRSEGPAFDEDRWPRDANGEPIHDLSVHDAVDRIKRGLDNIEAQGLKYDALYYDGYSAYHPLPEDFSQKGRITRRMTWEAQNACFAETRRRGIMPAAELARFWCIRDCDYFFFTDWSSDRLSNTPVQGAPAPVGEPIPLFQLVFHDCYLAGFSGGGYAVYTPGYDWWEDRTPRLYELMFASAPAYNWLPEGNVPVRNLNSAAAQRCLAWLKRWSAYYRAIATSEMVSHQVLSPDRKLQRIAFANGVVATFNMGTNEFCVTNVAGFSGEWEKPQVF